MSYEAPDPAALRWATGLVGPSAAVTAVRRLRGGVHASTSMVTTVDPPAVFVLRQYPRGDDAAHREAEILRYLDGLGGLAPRLLGSDPDGEWTGRPSLVTSRVPGHPDLRPADVRGWATGLGRALATIHDRGLPGGRDHFATAAPPGGGPPDGGPLDGGPLDGGPLDGGPAAIVRDRWERLGAQERVLTHFDFWSGNVLWEATTVTGVVDWSGARLAPRGFDVSWCRLDLVLVEGPGAAEIFLDAYERASGQPVPDLALWDLHAIAASEGDVESWYENYAALGRADLTAGKLRRRHAAWAAARISALSPAPPTPGP